MSSSTDYSTINPSSMTIQQLKSFLTEHDVIDMGTYPKKVWVEKANQVLVQLKLKEKQEQKQQQKPKDSVAWEDGALGTPSPRKTSSSNIPKRKRDSMKAEDSTPAAKQTTPKSTKSNVSSAKSKGKGRKSKSTQEIENEEAEEEEKKPRKRSKSSGKMEGNNDSNNNNSLPDTEMEEVEEREPKIRPSLPPPIEKPNVFQAASPLSTEESSAKQKIFVELELDVVLIHWWVGLVDEKQILAKF